MKLSNAEKQLIILLRLCSKINNLNLIQGTNLNGALNKAVSILVNALLTPVEARPYIHKPVVLSYEKLIVYIESILEIYKDVYGK